MISLLSKLFIKDGKNYTSPKVRSAYGMLCGFVGIFFNLVLFSVKLIAGLLTASVSITADAFNNLSDAGSSIITLIGFKMSEQKPDIKHPFGHGRIEYIAGLIVSMLIIIMGYELGKSSVEKIFSPSATEYSLIAVIILACLIIVKLYMFAYNTLTAKKIKSEAMKATASDSISDVAATSAVLICTLVTKFTSLDIDAYCGLAVSLMILVSGIKSTVNTVNPLLGLSPDPETVKKIEQIVLTGHPEILGIHDLVIHDYGPGRMMISLHAEVSSGADMLATHDAIDNIEKELRDTLRCEAVIHMDPIEINNERVNEMKAVVGNTLAKIDSRITMHDFRMVSGPTHTNVIFDIVIPYDDGINEEETVRRIGDEIHAQDETCYAVISVDRSFVK